MKELELLRDCLDDGECMNCCGWVPRNADALDYVDTIEQYIDDLEHELKIKSYPSAQHLNKDDVAKYIKQLSTNKEKAEEFLLSIGVGVRDKYGNLNLAPEYGG